MEKSKPIIKPPALKKGATIGIIAPASPLAQPEYLERGREFWRSRGYRVRTGTHINKAAGSPAGNDADRLSDLHLMFRDPEIGAIICLRGGYGSLRLLAGLDYELVLSRPKILVGYSDITALHLALNKITGLVTFHGPMIYPELGGPVPDPYTEKALFRALAASGPPGTIPRAPGLPAPVSIIPGKAEGVVTGGNLSLVTATLGTPFEIDTRGKILFLEEVDEAPYRLDRMLTQLQLAGKLEEATGIVFGHCTRCDDTRPGLTALEVITARLKPLGRPCFYGLPAGHIRPQATLPLGIRARLDATTCTLTYLETATSPI